MDNGQLWVHFEYTDYGQFEAVLQMHNVKCLIFVLRSKNITIGIPKRLENAQTI